ncbi:hypothetical protein [Nocardia nepalensis]|uniref:hypothetical protein n=1 Tax=Nocardia nepalensis TaxID=3375448 RepID=UPI003B66DA2A
MRRRQHRLSGGHSDAALRRAVRLGDGWMHAGGDDAELARLLDRIDELRGERADPGAPFEIHVVSPQAYSVDGIARLAERGVTDVIVGFRPSYEQGRDVEPLATKIARLEQYAETVIANMR